MYKKIRDKNMKNSLLKKVGKLLDKVDKIRIFPASTEELQAYLDMHDAKKEEKEKAINELQKFINEKLNESEWGFVFSNKNLEIKIDLKKIEEVAKKSFENDTIVYMNFNISNGNICLDDTLIAKVEIGKQEIIKLIKKRIEEYIQNSIHVLNTDLQYVEPDKK